VQAKRLAPRDGTHGDPVANGRSLQLRERILGVAALAELPARDARPQHRLRAFGLMGPVAKPIAAAGLVLLVPATLLWLYCPFTA